MKSIALIGTITCIAFGPAMLAAQQSGATGSASTSSNASTTAKANASADASVVIPASYSAEASAKIRAAFDRAREKQVPSDQMKQRMAEGQAKGASDVAVASSVEKSEARLEASQSAFLKAGRSHPQPDEVTNGAQAMERGATEAQLVAVIRGAAPGASVAATLNALAQPAGAPGAAGAAVGANVGATAGAAGAAATGAVTGVLGVPPKKP